MSLISLKDIEKSFGAREILKGVCFNLEPGDRAGLIGANGSGKTTILEIIAGIAKQDSGSIASAKGLSIGYLAQESGTGSSGTIIEEMLSARPEVLELKIRLDKAAEDVSRLASGNPDAYERALNDYSTLLDELEKTGGYEYDNAVTGALRGLGFDKGDFARPLTTLSGGQRTRISLAKILLAGHGLLMLDEPTNHLDISSIAWLEEFLKQYQGAVLLVSHDRYFLDRVATRILELSSGRIEEYPGNYTLYTIEKEKRDTDRLRQYELMSGRLEKEKEYINRMRAGVHARQAKGREKRLERFELPDRPAARRRAFRIRWPEITRSSDTVIKAESVAKGFGSNAILGDASFNLRRGERAGIIGRNGIGKTTLLRIITGEMEPDSGTVTTGQKVKTGYYAQGLEGLDGKNTVLEELWFPVEPLAVEQKIRDILGSFLFTGDDSLKMVSDLSGGEKGRLALAKIALSGANLLVLDEPTNHLDIKSREVIEEALSAFEGTILAVSHDRFFLDKVVGKVFELDGGRLTEYYGNYSYYSGKKTREAEEKAAELTEGRQSWEERKQRQAEEKKKEREQARRTERLISIEADIEDLEKQLRQTEELLARPEIYEDYSEVTRLTECYNILKDKRDQLYEILEEEAF